MISFKNILTIRSLSLFRNNFACTCLTCNHIVPQIRKSNFHQCMSRYRKQEESACPTKEFMFEGKTEVELKHTSKKPSLREPFARLTGRYQLMYTCKQCNTRNSAVISKIAYHHGAVVASCRGCKANHLIADNLKWFGDKKQNIEDILKEKGESVMKITAHDLFLEVLPPDAPDPMTTKEKEEMKKLPPLSL